MHYACMHTPGRLHGGITALLNNIIIMVQYIDMKRQAKDTSARLS